MDFIKALQRTGFSEFQVHYLHRQIHRFYGITQNRYVKQRLRSLVQKGFLEIKGARFIIPKGALDGDTIEGEEQHKTDVEGFGCSQ